jgi:hypothetical protein
LRFAPPGLSTPAPTDCPAAKARRHGFVGIRPACADSGIVLFH